MSRLIRNESVEAIKWLALACMVLDHVGTVFFDGAIPALNAIGRVAMPAFGMALAFNLARRDALACGAFRRSLNRMLAVGFVALPFHIAAFDSGLFNLNIMFTFAAAVGVLWLLEKQLVIPALLVFLIAGRFVEYWWFGIAVVIASYYHFRDRTHLTACGLVVAVAALGYVNASPWALLSLPLAALLTWREAKLPRAQWAFYAFYPAHLGLLAFIAWVVS